nr:uncharacterized protein LOC105844061 isoform X2 [Hydra vulgaris]XP_047135297.1 uncharacterized protein LOC105844061 isoform X2 [Hydra vulgaris]XP_047135298.1 uncharacterized protein LOC105844061 isoform X2 [Hydra vulgaris]
MVKDLQNVSSVVSEDLQINALNSIEQLMEVDATLNDSVIFSKWVSQIAKIGGVNLKDNVKRVIERLLTIELRCLLNMKEQTNSTNKTKQKLAFSKTKLYRVLVDENLNAYIYPEHQLKQSLLISAGVKCINQFALDYMHLVCFGVVKRISLFVTKEGPSICKLSQKQKEQISSNLEQLKGTLSSEFAR